MKAIRPVIRWLLWLHAALWCLFALGMSAAALMSPEALADPVFLQVLVASNVAAVGSLAAARYRVWGVVLALLSGCGVVAAWFAGNSGDPYRHLAGAELAAFLLTVAIGRGLFVSPPVR